MQIDLSSLASWWWLILFCVGVYIFSALLRSILEGIFPKLKVMHFWNEAALPTLPVVVGVVSVLISKKYPFPVELQSTSAQIFLGAAGGHFAGWGYRMVKAVLKSKTGIDPDAKADAAPETKAGP